MKAQLKCSNCGAEISNLNLSWGRKHWLWFIPLMTVMIFLPLFMNHILREDKHDFRPDLSTKEIERRYTNGTVEILGVVENHGKVNWEHIAIQADLYGKDGKFLDQLIAHTPLNLSPGASGHFKMSSKEFPQSRWEAINDMKVKVSDAYHSPFGR